MRKYLRVCGVSLAILVGFIYFNNANFFSSTMRGKPILLAHRGIHQRFDNTDLKNDTCTATRMLPPTNNLLENTIPSMQASFKAGADIIELDIHPTTDGQFAVFHDWTLECRTNGHGVTREHSMAELKKLDIGYGYTADKGRTFPFRGKGVGLMPSLDEVLQVFPNRSFLLNIKSNDPREGEKLAKRISRLPLAKQNLLLVYGGEKPISTLTHLQPNLKTMSQKSLKNCLLRYIAYGWTGNAPIACRNQVILVPSNVAPWLWGWPERFLERMASVDGDVFMVGPYNGKGFLVGIDTNEDVAQLPVGYSGGVLTDNVEHVGRILKDPL